MTKDRSIEPQIRGKASEKEERLHSEIRQWAFVCKQQAEENVALKDRISELQKHIVELESRIVEMVARQRGK